MTTGAPPDAVRVVIVTGLSGAGKSTAIRALEDLGFFCVDNLPAALFRDLLEVCRSGGVTRVALGMDLRSREFAASTPRLLAPIRAAGFKVELLYLDATDEALIRRFSETRRRHPLAEGDSAVDGIRQSTALAYLNPVRGRENLQVRGGEEVDRVLVDGGRAVGVRLRSGEEIAAATVVLAAGTYNTPAILMRSGI